MQDKIELMAVNRMSKLTGCSQMKNNSHANKNQTKEEELTNE